MILFLTSSPTGPLDNSYSVDGIDPRNGLRDRLRHCWPTDAGCLMITAFPDDPAANDEMRSFFQNAFLKSGFSFTRFDLWDARFPVLSAQEVHRYSVIILGGGHVPTQHRFFESIQLAEKLTGYAGLVLGISAGSMNAARLVYAQPERPGESVDPEYNRFFPGLGLTDTMILPHYQMVRHFMLDNRRLFEDITCPDSMGHRFLVLPDGSYLVRENATETVYGEAYSLENGSLARISSENTSHVWLAGN